ncbi:hypothetical protein IAU59_006583 [Kwoniella sp. CBS 9459]
MQRPSSVPPATANRIHQQSASGLGPPQQASVALTDQSSSGSGGWVTTTSSYVSSNQGDHPRGGPAGSGSGYGDHGKPPPLAWAGVRHQGSMRDLGDHVSTKDGVGAGVQEGPGGGCERGRGRTVLDSDRPAASHCSQAVLITCLHLSHEMNQRDVGTYGWINPLVKDPMGSMIKIMKQYCGHIRALSKHELNCRSAPDPSKTVIQHHLQRARLAAGHDSYVAVVYNGHGIQEPPTEQGELWCHDKGFDECLQSGSGPSEYIPIMLFDVLAWAGASTCYVWDCSHAGRIIRAAHSEANEIDNQYRAAAAQNPNIAQLHPPVFSRRQIHFAACAAGQTIPRVHGMPDDLFTACLTTPLRIALLFHNLQTFPLTKGDGASFVQRNNAYMAALWENMSQNLKDRLWYELTAITHTIAWQTIEGWEYQKLFGKSGDVVNNFASGFLLAQRVLGAYRTTPESIPTIPSSTGHALWTTWDLILDNLFEQLPGYFDEGAVDTTWEKDLKLVSFMADQLESITTAGQLLHVTEAPKSGMTPGLTRLPIICSAAMTTEFRVQACTALDSCLRVLDVRGLAHAVQGGALDVAARLLELEDPETKLQVISIWSSLVRYDVAVLALAQDGLTADRLTEIPAVKYFLSALEESLGRDHQGDGYSDPTSEEANTTLIIQTAAVLSTIAKYVRGRSAPRFVLRTVSMVGVMLRSRNELVQQWGALLIGEVLGSLDRPEEKGVIDGSEESLLRMAESSSVESRATAVYALSRWIPLPSASSPRPQISESEVDESIDLAGKLVEYAFEEGSSLVRRELARMFVHVLDICKGYTEVATWVNILRQAVQHLPTSKAKVEDAIKSTGRKLETTAEQLRKLKVVQRLLDAIRVFSFDPDSQVATIVSGPVKDIFDVLASTTNTENDPQGLEDEGPKLITQWTAVSGLCFPGLRDDALTDADDEQVGWTEEMLDLVISSAAKFDEATLVQQRVEPASHARQSVGKEKDLAFKSKLKGRFGKEGKRALETSTDRRSRLTDAPTEWRWNTDLFDKTKLSLQAYLAAGRSKNNHLESQSQNPPERVVTSHTGDSKERTFIMRHRLLEDSLVVAEQQVGLPWKWRVKDIVSPDPWSSMSCHSFHPLIMACNGSQEIMMYDWGNARKTGSIRVDLPTRSRASVTSARFVNELHDQIVIVAEISNGDIHILAGSQDPSQIKPIACFHALDLQIARPLSSLPAGMISSSVAAASSTSSGILGRTHATDAKQPRSGTSSPRTRDRPRGQKRMVNTWFRSSGLLCVGGESNKINVWDCPAERCVKTVYTDCEADSNGHRHSSVTTLITEPVSGNLIFSGSSDGILKLYDLRQARKTALLSWRGDVANDSTSVSARASGDTSSGRAMRKVGVVLGESKNITSACANGTVNTYDLRKLSEPISSILAHQDGIAAASFQGHSGLLSTISNSNLTGANSSEGRPTALSTTTVSPSVTVEWAIHRSVLGQLGEITKESITFPPSSNSTSSSSAPSDDNQDTEAQTPGHIHEFSDQNIDFEPYTVFHPLRPFVSIGLANTCYLRGCGVGQGDDTDSGSYSFLRSQAELEV